MKLPAPPLVPLLAAITAFFLSFGSAAEEPWSTAEERNRTFEALIEVFRRYYWDPSYSDWDAWGDRYRDRALASESRESFDRVLSQMVRALGDDHSVWLGQLTFADGDDLAGEQESRFGFRARLLPGTGLVVERVYPGSAAAEAGLQRGDVVVSIGDSDLRGPRSAGLVWQVLAHASRSETVEFELLRGASALRLKLAPAPFPIELASDMPQAEMLDEHLGYLYLPSFNRLDVAEEVHRLIADMKEQGLTQLILDLRGNPGGRIGELGLTLGAFLEGNWARAVSRGDVVWQGYYQVRDEVGAAWLEGANGRILLQRHLRDPVRFEGPLVVLVDNTNSSAGELAALVLQERGLARVVGEETAGNVEAVQSFDLPDGSVVMVAVANLVGSSGADFSEGVVPDVAAEDDLQELARGYDAPLAQAIRLLRELPFTPNRYFGGVAAN